VPEDYEDLVDVSRSRKDMTNRPTVQETRMVYPIFPGSANHYDTLFGGQAMAWMDQAAFICATRWCRQKVVTAHSSAIDFHKSIPVGSIVELVAKVVKVGRSSMTIHVQLWVESMKRDERSLGCEGTFVLVAVDENNRPVSVPPLVEDTSSSVGE
jgi:acyl-CoA hydrolase